MNTKEVKDEIWRKLNYKYSVWSRLVPDGIEIGINWPDNKGSLCSLLPIDDESRPKFIDFMVKEYKEKLLPPTTQKK